MTQEAPSALVIPKPCAHTSCLETSAVGVWGDLSSGNHHPATASWHLCAAAERPCAKLSSRESKVEDSLKGKTIYPGVLEFGKRSDL